jgi:hypothetical protein
MPSLSDLKGKKQRELLQSLHHLHRVFVGRRSSVARVGITFVGLRGPSRTWGTLEDDELIKVERAPGKSPRTATVWLTDAGHALFKTK